jgi:hypothetical protein
MKAFKTYSYVITFHLIFSFLFLVIFTCAFGYRASIIPLHLILVAALIVGTTLLLDFLVSLRRFRESQYARHAVAAIPTIGFSLLILLYIADYIANSIWGDNITFKIVQTYVPQLKCLLQTLSVPMSWIFLFLVGLVGTTYAVYYLLAKGLIVGLEELNLVGRLLNLFRDHNRAFKWCMLFGFCLLVFLGLWIKHHNTNRGKMRYNLHWLSWWKGEPILDLFMYSSSFGTDPHRVAVAQEDQRVRATYPPDPSFEKRNVILIMVDSLRADHMQVYGYERPTTPFLSTLLAEGQLSKVDFALSMCSESLCGILCTMASRNFDSLSFNNFKLNDLLWDLGYKIHYILSGDHSSWYHLRRAYGSSFDSFCEGRDSDRYSINDDRLLLEKLLQVRDYDGTPTFFFFFLMSAHYAGTKHEIYELFKPTKDLSSKLYFESKVGELDRVALVNRYDNGVIQADAFVEKLFDALDNKGYLKNSLVVILADHGEGLGRRGNYAHSKNLYQEDIRIPILFYDDTQFPYANLEFATQLDVAPTIVDRLGLPIPSCWEGASLLEASTKSYSYHQTRTRKVCRAVIHRTEEKLYKYLRWGNLETPPEKEELYELSSDPEERLNLIPTVDVQIMRGLRQNMAEHFGVGPG